MSKMTKLEKKIATIILFVMVIGIVGVALQFFVYKPNSEQIDTLTNEIESLADKVEEAKKAPSLTGEQIKIISVGSDLNDVDIDVLNIVEYKYGQIILKLKWNNNTDKIISYGNPFKISKSENGKLIELEERGYWDMLAYQVFPLTTEMDMNRECEFNISAHYDIGKEGIYQFKTSFYFVDDATKQYDVWVDFSIVGVNSVNGDYGNSVDEESLKIKYPTFFDLPIGKGLEVYVWQMAGNSYSCGLLSGKNSIQYHEEIMKLIATPATLDEMKVIVASYFPKISRDDVSIIPIVMPHSSYRYDINDEYKTMIESLFWDGFQEQVTDKYSPEEELNKAIKNVL